MLISLDRKGTPEALESSRARSFARSADNRLRQRT